MYRTISKLWSWIATLVMISITSAFAQAIDPNFQRERRKRSTSGRALRYSHHADIAE